MRQVPVTLITRTYAYVQPPANGDVRADGIDLHLIRTWDALLRVAANPLDVHGGEASFGRYLLGLASGDRSMAGLPIFIMRGFRQRCFFVCRDSPLHELADLAGKRIGINEWPATGNTWARGLLREQRAGANPGRRNPERRQRRSRARRLRCVPGLSRDSGEAVASSVERDCRGNPIRLS
jgi:hypothetical protein